LREDMERVARHDLKAPLVSVISGAQYLLKKGALQGVDQEVVQGMSAAGYRMLRMVNLSLDMFKMETGVYRLSAAHFDLLPVLDTILRDLAPIIGPKGLMVERRVAGGADASASFMIYGEELLCYSMLLNLLKNAAEASPYGETVEILLEDQAGASRIAIGNAGATPVEIRERFFDKYVTRDKSGGTGLGTYSARLIAETHGGEIRLDASVEGRTTVWVRLPKAGAAREARTAS